MTCTAVALSVAAPVAFSVALELEEDHVEMWCLPWRLSRSLLDPNDEAMLRTSRVILEALVDDGAMLGDFVDTTGEIAPWPPSAEGPINRVVREWRALGREPNMGDIGWLTLPADVSIPLEGSAVSRLALSAAQRLAETIEHESRTHSSVSEYEPLLVAVLCLLESIPEMRDRFVDLVLLPLVATWPSGGVEIVEFTMRTLRWPEISAALRASAVSDPDVRHRELARRALRAFEDDWETGHMYVYHRPAESPSRWSRLRTVGRSMRSFLRRR